jgi:starvation-inducible outer membrane lipoprotein
MTYAPTGYITLFKETYVAIPEQKLRIWKLTTTYIISETTEPTSIYLLL